MKLIDIKDIRKIDDLLISKNVLIHQRPYQATLHWMEQNKIKGDISTIGKVVNDIYKILYPSQNFSFPTLLVGGIAFRDQFYITRIPLICGKVRINLFDFVTIERSELNLMHNVYNEQYKQAMYCICDLYDIAFGIDDLLRESKSEDMNYWLKMVLSSTMSTAFTLSEKINLDNAIQSVLLSVELAIKSNLLYSGCEYSIIKGLQHSKLKTINKLVEYKKIKKNGYFEQLYDSLPEYVPARYNEQNLSKSELVNLAIKSQFLVAEMIRDMTKRNLAKSIGLEYEFERPDFL